MTPTATTAQILKQKQVQAVIDSEHSDLIMRRQKRTLREYMAAGPEQPPLELYQSLIQPKCDCLKLLRSTQEVQARDDLNALNIGLATLVCKVGGFAPLVNQLLQMAEIRRAQISPKLNDQFYDQVDSQQLQIFKRGSKLRSNLEEYLRLLLEKTNVIERVREPLVELLAALGESKIRNSRQAIFTVVQTLTQATIEQYKEEKQSKKGKDCQIILQSLYTLLKARERDVDSVIRNRATRCLISVLKSCERLAGRQNLATFLQGQTISAGAFKLVKELLEQTSENRRVRQLLQLVTQRMKEIAETLSPKTVRSQRTAAFQTKFTNKTATIAGLSLIKTCLQKGRTIGVKFIKNRDLVNLSRKLLLCADEEVSNLLLQTVMAKKLQPSVVKTLVDGEKTKQPLLSLYKLVRFFGKVGVQPKFNWTMTLGRTARLFLPSLGIQPVFDSLMREELAGHKLSQNQLSLLFKFALRFVQLWKGKDPKSDRVLSQLLLTHSKEIIHSKMTMQHQTVQSIVSLYLMLDPAVLREQPLAKLAAVLQMLEVLIYCKRSCFLVRKAVALLTLFVRSEVEVAVACLQRVFKSVPIDRLDSCPQEEAYFGLCILLQISESIGILAQNLPLELNEIANKIAVAKQRPRQLFARMLLNEHNRCFKALMTSSVGYQQYQVLRQEAVLLSDLLLSQSQTAESNMFAFKYTCQLFSTISHDRLIQVKFLYVQPREHNMAKLFASYEESVDRVVRAREEPMAGLVLDDGVQVRLEQKTEALLKLLRTSCEISALPCSVRLIYRLLNCSIDQLHTKGVAMLESSVAREVDPMFEKQLCFWKVVYQLMAETCVRQNRPGKSKDLAKLVLKLVFFKRKKSQIAMHVNKLILFVADSIQKLIDDEVLFPCFSFLQKLLTLARSKVAEEVLRKLYIFALNKRNQKVAAGAEWKDSALLDSFLQHLRTSNSAGRRSSSEDQEQQEQRQEGRQSVSSRNRQAELLPQQDQQNNQLQKRQLRSRQARDSKARRSRR